MQFNPRCVNTSVRTLFLEGQGARWVMLPSMTSTSGFQDDCLSVSTIAPDELSAPSQNHRPAALAFERRETLTAGRQGQSFGNLFMSSASSLNCSATLRITINA